MVSYCVVVLLCSFLEELCELFLESCLPGVCLMVHWHMGQPGSISCGWWAATCSCCRRNLLSLFWHSCDRERVRIQSCSSWESEGSGSGPAL